MLTYKLKNEKTNDVVGVLFVPPIIVSKLHPNNGMFELESGARLKPNSGKCHILPNPAIPDPSGKASSIRRAIAHLRKIESELTEEEKMQAQEQMKHAEEVVEKDKKNKKNAQPQQKAKPASTEQLKALQELFRK